MNKKSPRPLALPHPFKKLCSGPCAGPRRRLTGKAILPSSSSRHTECFALPEPWPAWRTSSGQPVSACCSSFRQVFEPFLPPLNPDRPRPAGTSTPSAAFLSPQSGVFPITCPLPVVMTGLVAPSGNLRKRPAFPEGHPSIPFSGTSRCPHLQTAAGPVVHTRTSFFRGWGLEKGTVLPQNAPSPTRNPLPIPRSTMLSCGRSKLCETRPSARYARLFCC